MSLTVEQARDQMSELFATAWSPRAVVWDGVAGKPPTTRAPLGPVHYSPCRRWLSGNRQPPLPP